MGSTGEIVSERIGQKGPISYSEFVEIALYDPAGFYAHQARAGRDRDFITSPELGPLFGAVLANALDAWWDELGRPDPFLVVEAGAGTGTLARTVLDSSPACQLALRYILVESSPIARAGQNERLSLEPPVSALGPSVDNEDGGAVRVEGAGPIVTSLPDLPAGPIRGIVLANELLDNLPFDVFQRQGDGWVEIRVGERDGRLVELAAPAQPRDIETLKKLVDDCPEGAVVPLQRAAQSYLRDALARVEDGRVVFIDYADTTKSMANQLDRRWLRTYSAQRRAFNPLVKPGETDITVDVAIDQLRLVSEPTTVRTQSDFLREHGLDQLVARAEEAWAEGAKKGDLESMKAKSRINEAITLTDPNGLGVFTVMEWVR